MDIDKWIVRDEVFPLEKFLGPEEVQLFEETKRRVAPVYHAAPLFDYTVIKVQESRAPEMVVFLCHGWTSDKFSMQQQVYKILKQASREAQANRVCLERIWFVTLNAPFYSGVKSHTTYMLTHQKSRLWWPIPIGDYLEVIVSAQDDYGIFDRAEPGLEFSCIYVSAVIRHFRETYAHAKLVLFGFSQGGGLVLNVAAIESVHGLIITSGLLTNASELRHDKKHAISPTLPVLHTHGRDDLTIFYEFGTTFLDFLRKDMHMTNVRHRTFQGYHEINRTVRRDIIKFLVALCEEEVEQEKGKTESVSYL